MKVKILIGDNDNVDFYEPILMSPEQRKKFIEFMKTLFDVVVVENGDDIRNERLGDKLFFREWTSDELRILLEIEDNEKVSERLGRSWMSVDIKRGEFMPEFMYWAHKKGYDIVQGNTKKLIEEFMNEKEKAKQARRNARQKKRDEQRKLKEKIKTLQSELRAIDLRRRSGIKTPGDEEKIYEIEKEIKEIKEKIKQSENTY